MSKSLPPVKGFRIVPRIGVLSTNLEYEVYMDFVDNTSRFLGAKTTLALAKLQVSQAAEADLSFDKHGRLL